MKFVGLRELVESLPKGAYVAGISPGYAYTWDAEAGRWIETPATGESRVWLVMPDGSRERLGG